MGLSAANLTVVNEGLTLIGATPLESASDSTPSAFAIAAVIDADIDGLIAEYNWKFAIKRTSITENVTAPTFGRAHAYDLPADYLRLLPPYPEDNYEALDWIIEGDQIVSDNTSPLQLRYVASITDPTLWPILFKRALSAKLGMSVCEKLTQSTSKYEMVANEFERRMRLAVRHGAIERVAYEPPLDSWVSNRTGGVDNTRSFF